MNIMKTIKLEKATLNFGAGKDQAKLEKGIKLIKSLVGIDPVKTVTNKRIPTWGLRPGLPIGCKLTLRREKAKEIVTRCLHAKDHTLKENQFDDNGNIAFGIKEYIDIEGAKYDPEIGIIGLEICITLTRPGYRIKTRNMRQTKIPKLHRISKNEAIEFMKKEFAVIVKMRGEE